MRALLRVWVLGGEGRGFADDAVDAEGALGLRARLRLTELCCAHSEVFGTTALPLVVQSLW